MKNASFSYFFILSIILAVISILIIVSNFIFENNIFAYNSKTDSHFINSIKNRDALFNEKASQVLKAKYWSTKNDSIMLFSSRNYFSKNNVSHDLLEEKKLICPPVPNEWLVNNNLDYSNPNILNEDSDKDGFTNLEEWQGNDPYQNPGTESSNPNNPNSHPLLWTKLKWNVDSISSIKYYLDFIGVDYVDGKEFFKIQPQVPIPIQNNHGKINLSMKLINAKLGEKFAELPILLDYYEKRQKIYKDICYDVSILTIKNMITNEYLTLIKKSTLYPESTPISIPIGITFDYQLTYPPEKIYANFNSYFELKFSYNKEDNTNKKRADIETYRLVRMDYKEAILEINNRCYSLPSSN